MGRKDKPTPTDGIISNSLNARMRQARQFKGISLTEMARKVDYTKSHLSSIENGVIRPSREIVKLYERELGLEINSLAAHAESILAPGRRRRQSLAQSAKEVNAQQAIYKNIDEAPVIRQCYGRDAELAELKLWVTNNRCVLVSVLGLSGIGKTTLVGRLVQQIIEREIPHEFEYLAWYSLRSAPPLETILERCIHFLSAQRQIHFPEGTEEKIATVLKLLREHRCLVVLDNFESVLIGNRGAGQYKDGYAEYGKLLLEIGESDHQSCFILTSQERPGEIPRLEGKTLPIRSMELTGLARLEEVKKFLKGEGLSGSDEDWQDFIQRYAGNPLALKLIAAYIRKIFNGGIASFLREGALALGNVSALLHNQFGRLSANELDLIYWLAIERGSASLDDLARNIYPKLRRTTLFEALKSLRERFLIEPSYQQFTLQPVILQYATNQFVERICLELLQGELSFFVSHALMKAQSFDDLRDEQIQEILQPVIENLISKIGKDGLENLLKQTLVKLRENDIQRTSYAAGNILTMLVALKGGNLINWDFSHLSIRQSYLQAVTLHDVNFSYADLSTSRFTETFKGVVSVAWGYEGRFLAAGTTTGEIRMWDIIDGALKLTFKGDASWICWSVTFHPDGSILASGGEDQTVRLWDTRSGRLLHTLTGHRNRVRSVAFRPDGSVLASSGEDQTVRLWDVRSGRLLHTLTGHHALVGSVAFHPDGSILASGSRDQTIRLWDVRTGACLHILCDYTEGDSLATLDPIRSVSFSPDGTRLVCGGEDGAIHVWETRKYAHLKMLSGHNDIVKSVAFCGDEDTIASGSDDETIRLWSVNRGECLSVLTGHRGTVWSVAFNAQRDMLVSGSIDRTIRLWDIHKGHFLKTLQGYTNAVRSIAFRPDETLLASAGEDRSIYIWGASTTQYTLRKVLSEHQRVIWSLAFSPDGNILASAGDDKVIHLWNMATGTIIGTLHGHTTWIREIAFSPDGRFLASGSVGRRILLWDVNTRLEVRSFVEHAERVRSIAFRPDGHLLASGSDDRTIRLWDTTTGDFTILGEHTLGVWTIAFSPDGKLLASGGEDGTIKLWDVASHQHIGTFLAHASWIGSLAFNPTGSILASGHGNHMIYLWDVKEERQLGTLVGHTGPISSIVFSHDNNKLVSGSHDGKVLFWDIHSERVLYTLQADRPYQRMNIAHAVGLNPAQIEMLKTLGAIEENP